MKPKAGSATYAGFRTRTLSVRGNGPRFVLLHGYTDSADTWQGVLREIAARGGSAVAVDLPGFGLADPLAPGPILPQLDAFVDELVSAESLRGEVFLVGNSLGGCISVRAATRGVPLAAVTTIGDPAAGPWLLRSFAGSPRTAWLLRLGMVPVPAALFRMTMSLVIRRILYGNPRTADRAVVERFLTWMHGFGGSRALLRQVRLLAAEIVDGHGAVELSCPLLVVHGRRDRIVPWRGSLALHAAVPGSRLVVDPRWGHCPQLDDPAGLTTLLLEAADAWLGSVPGSELA